MILITSYGEGDYVACEPCGNILKLSYRVIALFIGAKTAVSGKLSEFSFFAKIPDTYICIFTYFKKFTKLSFNIVVWNFVFQLFFSLLIYDIHCLFIFINCLTRVPLTKAE